MLDSNILSQYKNIRKHDVTSKWIIRHLLLVMSEGNSLPGLCHIVLVDANLLSLPVCAQIMSLYFFPLY